MHNKSDKLDHLIALAAMKCAEEEAQELNKLDTSNVNFDSSYYSKRSKIINKHKRRPTARLTRMVAIRVAAVLVVLITLGCVMIGCVPEWREAIFNAIVEWYNDYFTVRYETPDGQEQETTYMEESTTEAETVADAPTYIEDIHKPADLPDGAWEDIVISNQTRVSIDYYLDDKYLFSFEQYVLKSSDKYIDNEDVNITHIKINGNDATIIESTDKKEINIFWSDNEYSYHMFSTERDLETLLRYAESVK